MGSCGLSSLPPLASNKGGLRLRDRRPEVQGPLLMRSRVQLAPQHPQQRRHDRPKRLGTVHPCVTPWTKGQHKAEDGSSRPSMVNDQRPLPCSAPSASSAAMAVALQGQLTQAPEVGLVLPAQGVADGTETTGQSRTTARAAERPLDLLHRLHGSASSLPSGTYATTPNVGFVALRSYSPNVQSAYRSIALWTY